MTRIDRYIFRAFATSYVPLVLAFTLLFVIADAFTRIDKFLKAGGPLLPTLARYYGSTLPLVFLRFGGFVTLAAGMFAVARLHRNNELMPIKAGGISVHRALVPIFVCAALLGGIAAANAELLIPKIAPEIRQATRFNKKRNPTPGLLRDRAGNALYAARYRPAEGALEWVTFRVFDKEGNQAIVYFADGARWVGEPGPPGGEAARGGPGERQGSWLLENGMIRDFRAEREGPGGQPRIPQRLFGAGPDGVKIETSIIPIDIESLSEPFSLLSFTDLRDQYLRQRYLPRLRVELHERITVPLSHLLLLLIGLPFVLREGGGRASVFIGLLALLVIAAGYFVLTFVFQAFGSEGAIPPFAAAWAPVVAFTLLGIGLLDRVRT
jgi:lipopolysaccharide export system permease protein